MNEAKINRPTSRSFLTRTAALAIGALSIAGMALVGTTSSASAGTAAETAAAPAVEVAARPDPRLDAFCLGVVGIRGARDRGCGRFVEVGVPGAIRGVQFAARRTSICVAVRGAFGGWDADCARRGGSVEASVRGVATSVRLFADDERLCGRASSDGRWGRATCSDRRGGLVLSVRGRGGIDGLQVWVARGGRR